MRSCLRALAGAVRPLIIVPALALALAGCGAVSPLERAGVDVAPPSGWRAVDPATYPVPGEPLGAWTGPEGGSLVVYRTLAGPGESAEAIGAELVNRMVNLPGVRIVSSEVVRLDAGPGVAGPVEAARVELAAPGTAHALAPSGTGKAIAPEGRSLVETRSVYLACPRPGGTVWACWHYPESARDRMAPVAAGAKVLRLGGAATRR